MSALTGIATRLGSLLGHDRVIGVATELQEFAVDGMLPGVAAKPRSAEEAAEVVRFAAREALTLIPCGSRSKLDIGMPPLRFDIALDMTGLQQIAHYDPGDLTLSVDAGMPLRQIEGALAEKKQFLPLAVPCFESSTVAGAVASGIDSTLRQQYGTTRDFLIGAEFIDGTGQLCRSGGRVVKNVTGYDLHKLLIGSLGTLGVITRLNFRTFPLPVSSRGHLAGFRDAEAALSYRHVIANAGLPLANLEILAPEITEIIHSILQRGNEAIPQSLDSFRWLVYAAYEGDESLVDRIARDLEAHSETSGAASSELLAPKADENLGGMLREAFEWLRWAAPAVALFRMVLPDLSPRDLDEWNRIANDLSLRTALLVRAAGVVYFALLAEDDDEAAMISLKKAVTQLSSIIGSRQGVATLLHAPLPLKTRINIWGANRADLGMMRKVKQAFDPQNIFAPGRFVGGL